MTVSDAITARFAPLHPRRIDLSLGRIKRLLADLGAPHLSLPPVIHVAGTNGKGSTVAFLRAILEAAGISAHVYTSPHLVSFNERIRLAGELVDDERLWAALDECIERALILETTHEIQPSSLPDFQIESRLARGAPSPPPPDESLDAALARTERDLISGALAQSDYNLTRAAERLKLTRHSLRYRMQRLGLNASDGGADET